MATTIHRPDARKSLRHSLKELLKCCKCFKTVGSHTAGSGILQTAAPPPPCLPELSQISLFPDFESSHFGEDHYSVSIPESFSLSSCLQSTPPPSDPGLSLLPVTRLSNVDLSQFPTHHRLNSGPQSRYETVQPDLGGGASLHASLASLGNGPSLRSSKSPLRIRGSEPILSSETQITLTTIALSTSTLGLRKSSSSRKPRSSMECTSSTSILTAVQPGSGPFITRHSQHCWSHSSKSNDSIQFVKHFGSFCVLDTFAHGCPVTATSEDLCYNLQIGEQFFLKIQECDGTSIDIVTGSNADGEEVIHLALFSPLMSPSTGKSRFLLAALVDITDFVREVSRLPDLDSIYEKEDRSATDAVVTPSSTPLLPSWSTRSHELLAEDLLSGCCLADESRPEVPNRVQKPKPSRTASSRDSEDVWLALAREERVTRDSRAWRASPTGKRSSLDVPRSSTSANSRATTCSTAVDEVLDAFMKSLQQLYSDSFLLARSPLDDKYYEICNVSPAVYASGEYVTGHLTHTAPQIIEGMSKRLGAGKAFSTTVQWGRSGDKKQLYCVPLHGQCSITWICFLVDKHMPALW